MKSLLKTVLLLATLVFAGNISYGQIAAGSYTIGTAPYATIAATITALNAQGVAGAVTFNVPAGYTETAPTGGYQLGSTTLNASLSATNTLTFQKSGAGVNPVLSAYTGGTATSSSATQDGIWAFIGTDYVTVDGINLADPNTANPATMEYGYGFYRASATDGCQNNIIKNCTITLNRINNAAQSGPMTEGCAGIIVEDATVTAATTYLTITAASGTNSNNKFYSNTIQNCNIGISMTGFTAASPYTLSDQGNDVGGASAATGNTIINWGGGGTNMATAVFMKDQWSFNISYNTINNNNGAGVSHTGALRGIWVNGSSLGASGSVNNNTVTVVNGGTTNQVSFIEVSAGGSGTTNTININNNSIVNCVNTTATSNTVYGIYTTSAAPQNLNINGNVISGFTSSSTGSHYLVYVPTALSGSNGVMNVNSNKILNFTRTATSGATYGFYFTAGIPSTTPFNFNGNKVSGVTYNTASSGSFYSVYDFSGTSPYPLKTCTLDTFSNITMGTGTFYGIYTYNRGAGSSINNSVVSNITLSGTFYGFYYSSSSLNGEDFSKNTVSGVVDNATSSTVYGLYLSGATAIDIHENNINNIQSAITTGSALYGMYISTATALNAYNNFISDLRTPAASSVSPIYGMYFSGGTAFNIYHNTINLNPVSSSTTNFGATGIYYGSAITPFDLRNNIVRVNAIALGTGFVAAVRRSAGTAGVVPSNLSTTTNSNIYYAPNAANSFLYAEGTSVPLVNAYNLTNDPSFNTPCALYKAFMTPRESSTFTENNLTQIGTTATYAPTGTSFAKSNAVATTAPAVTLDYNGVTRANPADAGALQFTGTGTDAAGPSISYTALPVTTFCTSNPVFTATITDVSGVNTAAGTAPRVYYKKSSEANVFGGANNSTFNGWKWAAATNTGSTFTFTIDYSLLTSPIAVNDSLTYFIVAQDLNATPNVGAVIAAFPTGYCPSSVALPAAAGPLLAAPASYGFRILNGSSVVINATQSQLCLSGTTTLSLSPAPNGYTIQWQQDNGTGTFVNIAGATGTTYTTPTLFSTNNYRAQLSCGGTLATTTATKTITVNNPSIASTTPGTRCGLGTVNLSATGSTGSVLNWYAAAAGGTALSTGPSFTTPVIGATTNFYVSATSGGGTQNFGKLTPTSTSGNTGLTDVGLMFDVTTSTTIQSVDVYALGTAGTGSLTVALKNAAGTVLQTTTYANVTVTAGGTVATTIPLNFTVPPGTDYRLVANGATGVTTLIREFSTGYTYPYTIPGIISITAAYTGGASASYYYYFYNWVVTTGCESPRTAVVATVTSAPTISVTSPQTPGICSGANATISVSSANSNYSYSWVPGGQTTSTISVSPTTATTYTVTATDNSGGASNGCVTKDSIKLFVNPQPGAPTIAPGPSNTICLGSSVALTGTPPNGSGTGIFGTGTTTNTTTGWPAPYTNWYGGNKHQMLLLASELAAAGMSAGSNINTIAYQVTAVGASFSGSLQNFQINMALTSATALTATAFLPAPTIVYGPLTQPIAVGTVTHTITPFVWDGVSNVVIQTLYSNANSGTSALSVQMPYSATSFVSTNYYYADVQPVATFINATTPTTAGSNRPNTTLTYSKPLNLNWINVNGLYKNATLTTALTAADTNKTVYASPITQQIYTAVTNLQGCLSVPSAPDTVKVNPVPIATITASPSATICAGQTTTLTAGQTGAGYTYQWSNAGGPIAGATGNTYTTGTAGAYKVTVTNTATTCSATTATATTVVINPLPTATATAAGTTTVCNGNTVQLNANTGAGLTYQWLNNGAPVTGATLPTYFATATGSYSVVVTNSNTCSNTSAPVSVLVNTTPAVITPQGTTTFCTGYSVVLQASTGANLTYVWQLNGAAIAGATNSSYTATASGNYTVIVTNTATTCVSTSAPVTVTVGAPPTSNITPTGTVGVCDGNSFTLTTNTAPGLTYQWYLNGAAIAGANGQTYTRIYTAGAGGGAGSYTANVSSGVGCSSTTTTPTIITVNPLPVVTATAGGNTTFCQGNSVTLTATPTTGLTYQWYNGTTAITGATATTYVAGATGSYTAKATNTNGCVGTSNAISVTVNPLPVISATAATATTFCQGGSVVLNAAPTTGLNYQWTSNTTAIPGATSSSYTATTSGNYAVMVTNSNGCVNSSSAIPVTVNPLPNVTLTPSGTINVCSGSTTTISVPAAAGQTYQWANGSGNITGATSAAYTTGTAGIYRTTVTITATGCQATSMYDSVVVNPLPTSVASIAGPTTICQGDTAKLSGNSGAGYTYQWRLNGNSIVGATSQTYNAIIAGTYTVAVTNVYGCTVVSNGITVTVNPAPAAYITYNTPLSFCDGGAVVLNANAGQGLTYTWLFNGAPIGNTTASNIATQQGAYAIKVTNTFGCTTISAPENITVWQVLQPVITMNNFVLSTGTYNSYQWYFNNNPMPGAVTQAITPMGNGFYKVTVKDIHNCQSTSEQFFVNGLGITSTVAVRNAIKVYPNPASSVVHVDAPVKVNLILRDVTGRTVMAANNAKEMDVTNMANGIYVLYINDTEGHTLKVEKVTKTNE